MNPFERTITRAASCALVTSLLLGASAPRLADSKAAHLAVELAPGSRLWLEGSSNVHDYHSEAKALALSVPRDSGQSEPRDAAQLERLVHAGVLKGLEFSIPIAAMRSGKDGLDHNLQKALKADKNPVIRFTLVRYKAVAAHGDSTPFSAEGTLSAAGIERTIELQALVHRNGETVVIEGAKQLLMSDFGIKPPRMMLGTLRTHDEVVVHYRLLLEAKPGSLAGKEKL